MRGRFYDFFWLLTITLGTIAWLSFDAIVFLIMAIVISFVLMRSYIYVLQVMHLSTRFVGGKLSTSTRGKPFDETEALGVDDQFPKDKGPENLSITIARPLGGRAFPACDLFELAEGLVGAMPKLGGREHGFAVVAKDGYDSLDGHIICYNAVIRLHSHTPKILVLLRMVKATEEDNRYLLPDEVWAQLARHPRFDAKRSPVFLAIDPRRAYLNADALGESQLYVPNAGVYRLKDFIKPGTKIPDIRAEFKELDARDAKAARAYAAKEIETRNQRIQRLENTVAAYQRLEYGYEPPSLTDTLATAVGGKDEAQGGPR